MQPETAATRRVQHWFQLLRNWLTRTVGADQRGEMTSHNGQLGIEFFDDECIQDPYPLYRRMLDTAPVHQIGNSAFYAVCSWDALNDAIARPEDFSSNLTATMTYQPGGEVGAFEMEGLGGKSHVLATADEPAHTVHRKALLPQLAAKRIRAFEPFIAETAERLWNANVRNGRIEWMGAMANRLPMMIVGRIIGVPDTDIDKLVRWGYAATQVVEGLVSQDQLNAAGIAVMERRSPVTHLIALRRLHLDHVGAVIRQDHRAIGATQHARQVDDLYPGKRARTCREALAFRSVRSIHHAACSSAVLPQTRRQKAE